MDVSETTKQICHRERTTLESKIKKNLAEIERLEAQIKALKANNKNWLVEQVALTADVPEPVQLDKEL